MEEEVERERKSHRRNVNEWDRVLSISLGQIDHPVDGSVTLNLRMCVSVCVRKLQYCTALVANEICSVIEEEQEMKGRLRCRSSRGKISGKWKVVAGGVRER